MSMAKIIIQFLAGSNLSAKGSPSGLSLIHIWLDKDREIAGQGLGQPLRHGEDFFRAEGAVDAHGVGPEAPGRDGEALDGDVYKRQTLSVAEPDAPACLSAPPECIMALVDHK